MPARKRKVALSDDWKANIQASQLMNRLFGCAMGEVEMTTEQLSAAKTVLAKILPDLARQDMNVNGNVSVTLEDALKRIVGV